MSISTQMGEGKDRGILRFHHGKASPSGPSRLKGFTLIETLLAVGTIAVLAVLLMGAFTKGVERSQATRCISHLRTLHIATVNYVADNNGELPIDKENGATGMSWYRGLERGEYLQTAALGENKSLYCPTRGSKYAGFVHYGVNDRLYASGSNLGEAPSGEGRDEFMKDRVGPRMSRFPNPSGTILYMDTNNDRGIAWYTIHSPDSADTHPVHGERLNVVFLDGHIASPRVLPREFGPNGDLGELKAEWFSPE